MAEKIQNLALNQKIVNEDGTPTMYFLRLLQDRGIISQGAATDADNALTIAQAAQADVDALELRNINTGTGLAGGGNLTADRTLSLNAGIDLLTDVNTTTTAPTNGQTLVWDSAASLWKPGTISGGGGGRTLIEAWTGTGSTGTKTFSSIPGTYRNLILEVQGRCSAAVITSSSCNVTVNSIGGTNYDTQRIFAQASSVAADEVKAGAWWQNPFGIAGTSVTSTFNSGGYLKIYDYAGTGSLAKLMEATTQQPNHASSGNYFTVHSTGQVRTSSAAITSLTITLGSGNWTTDSQLRLYGEP